MVGATYTHNIRHMITNDERFFFLVKKLWEILSAAQRKW